MSTLPMLVSNNIRRHLLIAALLSLAGAAAQAQSNNARIDGVVRDSVRGLPLASATVVATPDARQGDTVFHSAMSDPFGRFALAGLPAGKYRLSVEHPVIDSTGIGAPEVEVQVPDGGAITAVLGIPSAGTLRRILCPQGARDSTHGIMLGTVRRTDGAPVAGAVVVFSWRDFDVDRRTVSVRSRQLNESVSTDNAGVYRACGLPLARALFVQAQTGPSEQSGVLNELIGENGFVLRDFYVARRDVAAPAITDAAIASSTAIAGTSTDTAVAHTFLLTGHVQRTDGSPIGNAQVNLLGVRRATTSNGAGEFRFNGVAEGTQGIEVISLGYFPRYIRVEVGADASPVPVQMEKVAVVLDSLRVIARRQPNARAVAYREFDARVKTGQGVFMTESQIANKDPVITADLFRDVAGVRLAKTTDGATFIASTRGRTTMSGMTCVMDIFLDGRKMNADEIDLVRPGDLHGVEIHAVATAPARYHVSQCGAVFLWTK